MRNKRILAVALAVGILGFVANAFAETTEDVLKKTFPNFRFESVKPTPVKGLYEIVMGNSLLYFAPEAEIMIFGEMLDKNGRNLTAERKNTIAEAKMKDLPLDKAVKSGSGKNIVIEFTDPDCPYCRKGTDFFKGKDNVTKYTFLFPLPMHPDAANKARYILCAKDRAKAFEEVMAGKLDGQKYETCKTPEVDNLLAAHQQIATKVGVQGTPYYVVNGTVVNGMNGPRIEQLLK